MTQPGDRARYARAGLFVLAAISSWRALLPLIRRRGQWERAAGHCLPTAAVRLWQALRAEGVRLNKRQVTDSGSQRDRMQFAAIAAPGTP
jgi:hypothetical protein